MEHSSKVPTFSGKQEDYAHWKRAFEGAVGLKGLDEFMDLVPPVKPNGVKELAEWDSRNADLYRYTILSVDPKTGDAIQRGTSKKNGIEAWAAIRQIFKRTDRIMVENLQSLNWLKHAQN